MLPRALAFSTVLAAALLVTLGLKAATLDYSVGDDEPRFVSDLEASLRGQGFVAGINLGAHFGTDVVAVRGRCQLHARNATRAYEMSDAFAMQSGAAQRLSYFIGDRRMSAPPALGTETLNVGQLTLARLGLAIARPATIAVADNGACDLGQLSFAGVKIHSRSHVF